MVCNKGNFSKTKVARLAEDDFPDFYHVMVILQILVFFPLPPIFFIAQTIEKTIHISLFCAVFAHKRNSPVNYMQ